MNDKELLELAALAAGYNIGFFSARNQRGFTCGFTHAKDGGDWNPLDNDGDALRLAAELRLKIIPGKHKGDGCTVESQQEGVRSHTVFFDNPIKEMRFAVIYVAAEIGKSMKVD